MATDIHHLFGLTIIEIESHVFAVYYMLVLVYDLRMNYNRTDVRISVVDGKDGENIMTLSRLSTCNIFDESI